MTERIEVADGGFLLWQPDFLSTGEADALLKCLEAEVPWRQEKTRWGHFFPRLTAWYADPGLRYSYAGVTHQPLAWTEPLWQVRHSVAAAAATMFNSLLLNYSRDGQDSIGFHADDEPELGRNPVIASLSLGAARTFVLRHNRSGQRHRWELSHGSLLIMAGTLQQNFKHAVPRSRSPVGQRINLTFRWIVR
jgi:alkylated DNA repair dioxygenase AlkB